MSKYDKTESKKTHDKRVHDEVTKAVIAPEHTSAADIQASQEMEEPPVDSSYSNVPTRELSDDGVRKVMKHVESHADKLPYEAPTLTRVDSESGLFHRVDLVTQQGGKLFAVCGGGCGELPVSEPNDLGPAAKQFDELVKRSKRPDAIHTHPGV